MAHKVGKVVNTTHQPLLPPGEKETYGQKNKTHKLRYAYILKGIVYSKNKVKYTSPQKPRKI